MRKHEIIRIVTAHMIDEHGFGEEALDDLPIESTDMSAAQTELEKVRIQAKLELEKTWIGQETRIRELIIARTIQGDNDSEFVIIKQIPLVLKFAGANIDEYGEFPKINCMRGCAWKLCLASFHSGMSPIFWTSVLLNVL